MKALDLIATYQEQHSGMSTYLDQRIQQIQIAIREALLAQTEGEQDWHKSNLYIAFTLAEGTLKAIPPQAPIRDAIADIYKAINEELKP
jgi:hypothetical protein